MEENLKRLNKFIGETGYCSRREADKLIDEGRVTLNGVSRIRDKGLTA
jgi:23S rRNA pseudouridine2604 synthase